jgi:hypothetical protein
VDWPRALLKDKHRFRLTYQNKPDNVFEATPESRQKLIDLITAVRKLGEFVTFDQAVSAPKRW